MGALIITNLEEAINSRLQILADQHGCSVEEEVKNILKASLLPEQTGIGTRIHQLFEKIGGVELALPARSLPRTLNPHDGTDTP